MAKLLGGEIALRNVSSSSSGWWTFVEKYSIYVCVCVCAHICILNIYTICPTQNLPLKMYIRDGWSRVGDFLLLKIPSARHCCPPELLKKEWANKNTLDNAHTKNGYENG